MLSPGAYTYYTPSRQYYPREPRVIYINPEDYFNPEDYDTGYSRPRQQYAPKAQYLQPPPIFTKYTCYRPEEYIQREPRSGRRVRFDDRPQYERAPRPSSPDSWRPTRSGVQYEVREPRGTAPPRVFERERRPYPPPPESDAPLRSSHSRHYVTREPRSHREGRREMDRAARRVKTRSGYFRGWWAFT
ncbi:hypothetical protein N7452_009591 [Penicillium brevicompactum]|uniref:Uncharacterized protein n=1 Tax=Penicillium brevicompactum TaxID=5074 RepID=A0A9W9Q8Q7_PENBR|nr:hypothetical protein N7452_009591 [Penicillium brevicompactum]